MIRSFDEEDDIENSFMLVLRNKEYKNEIYKINEKIKHNKNTNKLYGYNKERNLNVVITKIMNISLEENLNFEKRLLITIKLIEENILLVENLWVEKTVKNNYNLYISELTNSIYRNEYYLITLNNYMNSTQNTYKENIEILISIVKKMIYFQSINFSHLNIHPNNIYINIKNNNIYFGPPKLVKNYSNDYTYLWYTSPEENYLEDELWENNVSANYNDIWSLGCIICEMFFINFPLFQAYSPNEKFIKIIEVLGFPEYKDVDFMNKFQYDSLIKKINNKPRENNLLGFLLSNKEEPMSNLYNFKTEIIDIINRCFSYNRANRISLKEMLKKLKYLNSNITTDFQSRISYSTNSEESETSYNLSSNMNNKINNITNNQNFNINNIDNINTNKINNNILKLRNMKMSIHSHSLDANRGNIKNINNIYNNNNGINSTFNYNIKNINHSKNNFYPILNIKKNHNYNYLYKNHKNLEANSSNIERRVKKIISDYENSKIEYEKYSKNEDNKKVNKVLGDINSNKNIDINIEGIKNKDDIKEKDEYKELYKSKLFYINYYLLYL